ncbi:hypothetical protein C1645_838090 [Glomus cerebriforme]|uniref:Uncharacterized protein n=1 Tax=Glomus cerebriforme TaxID=658196 RepID=A0A397S7R4_9GLOM|nr:hypothetical protein C1645_838090 [Glomus cerebriforme]
MGGRKNSSQILIGQFTNYRNKKAPYDHEFIDEDSSNSNQIKYEANLNLSNQIRIFKSNQIKFESNQKKTDLNLQIQIKFKSNVKCQIKLRIPTNAKAELKYVYQDLLEEKFYEKVEKHLSEHLTEDDIVEVEDDYDYDNNEDKIDDEDEDEDDTNNKRNDIEKLNVDFRNDFEELNANFRERL